MPLQQRAVPRGQLLAQRRGVARHPHAVPAEQAAHLRQHAGASAPSLSVLFRNMSVGIFRARSMRKSVTVWLCTPSAQETTSSAASSTDSARSISPEKSTWPGVSISVTQSGEPSASRSSSDACSQNIVMPRARSSGSPSMNASP